MPAACNLRRKSSAACGSAVRFDEADRILHRHDLFGRVIRDLAPNSSSKAITSSTVSRLSAPRSSMKLAFFGHLRFVDAQMLDDDLLDPISDVTHPFLSSVACWNR